MFGYKRFGLLETNNFTDDQKKHVQESNVFWKAKEKEQIKQQKLNEKQQKSDVKFQQKMLKQELKDQLATEKRRLELGTQKADLNYRFRKSME